MIIKNRRFKAIFIQRFWSIPEGEAEDIKAFAVGTLLREGGWVLMGCRPSQVDEGLAALKGWGLSFGTLAFRRHYPYRKGRVAWTVFKNHILREDIQEVVVIGYKPPFNGKGLKLFAARNRPFLTNYPTRWEYDTYWKTSVMFGYPRLEIWARNTGAHPDPKKWHRIGPQLDGMPIRQSLWLAYAELFSTAPD